MIRGFGEVRIVSKDARTYLAVLSVSQKFLFHVTNEENCKTILKTGYIEPLTMDWSRSMYKYIKAGEEKGTASFTANPVCMLEEDGDAFEDKDFIIVFNKDILVKQGVQPVKYAHHFESWHKDLMTAPYENSHEHEWRSLERVNISGAVDCIVRVQPRVYNPETNALLIP